MSDFLTTFALENAKHIGNMERNIVLNIPHSSVSIPKNTWVGDISKHVAEWTDLHTDKLFSGDSVDNVYKAVFPYSRFFVDVERLIDDPMEKYGQGIFYTLFKDCKRVEDNELKAYCYEIRQQYLNFLSALLTDGSILIDCHSFPTKVAEDIDINIGFNDDWSKPDGDTLKFVIDYFSGFGYNVGVNSPYSNSITPFVGNYTSFMIEVNKKLYLRENGDMKPDAYKLNAKLKYLYKTLLNNDAKG